MTVPRYEVNQHSIQTLLTWIETGAIAIPEIQRPFVWSAAKVRDFIDSLYFGYPVGYLIAWQNPSVRLKDGTTSSGKRILIDGQQRVTALLAALLGRSIIDKGYKSRRIVIAFHPTENRFEVANPAISHDRAWIGDIAIFFQSDFDLLRLLDSYCGANADAERRDVFARIQQLQGIKSCLLGLIDLNSDLDVETVSEVFIRINSKGVSLNAADFAMSKIAAKAEYDGHFLRKCIDYFCHLAVAPEDYPSLSADEEFSSTKYFQAMGWLRHDKDDLYDPSYVDVLRVALAVGFQRGRLNDLVALLSGRNFESREFEEAIAERSFSQLDATVLSFMNETNFKTFVMILKSAGFITSSLIGSQNAVNFAYILLLTLRRQNTPWACIEQLVRRWFVMSVLTGRYSGSPETAFGVDIRNIAKHGASQYLESVEKAEMSDAFWRAGLPQRMDSSSSNSPIFSTFLASQVKANDKGFLSRDLTVQTLLQGSSHIHHVFPSNFLKSKLGLPRNRYNQIANYCIMQASTNIAIGDRSPAEYFTTLSRQCENGEVEIGGIASIGDLRANLAAHCIPIDCIPTGSEEASVSTYDNFLEDRRLLISYKIRDYYRTL